jgi:tRNA uridine 5-carboxymethylaminomethyl modification enzyme
MVELPKPYDVVVVGSGHAGIEAALAAARIGCATLVVTQNLDTVGQMSCNPAIGGTAKGHIVREIDALGGAMGENADATGIQFRILNRAKGPSVQALRVQCDKKAYQFRMKAILERTPSLDLKQASVTAVIAREDEVTAIETDIGLRIRCRAVVVTSGTFLRGLLHVGENSRPGGRMADASSGLSDSLKGLGFEVRRFKTGTPCRLNRRSIDFSRCEIQLGDTPPPRFSFRARPAERSGDDVFTLNAGSSFHVEQMPCWVTHTTPQTHDLIRDNLHRSPLYSGRIAGTGPRYCPSIEDKVVKFSDKTSHQLFLEPEGRHTEEFYVNGISTSLPYDVQIAVVRSIPGLERAEIMRPGYAVEYDYFPPTQLRQTLETKLISGLYFAGQVNGTSGYEEAAGQGLVVGANAALKVLGRDPLILSRNNSYLGVMVEDLTIRGTDEPYRMFTSRAEERLSLRHDTADQRLTGMGRDAGLISDERWGDFSEKSATLARLRTVAAETTVRGTTVAQLMRRADFDLQLLPQALVETAPTDLWALVATEMKYEGYIRRQAHHNRKLSERENQRIPDGLEFDRIPGLRRETRQKLAEIRPTSIGALSRISGITPADLSIISIWLISNQIEQDTAAVQTETASCK